MKRIGILKFWALGDILMATPLINAIRAAHPDVHITWVVDESHGSILKGHSGIDELVILDSGKWRRLLRKGNLPGWGLRSQQLHQEMAARNWDAVINCHPDKWWTAILCAAPERVGLYPSRTLPWSQRFYTHPIARPPGLHSTEHYLLATRALGMPDAGFQMSIGETPEERPFVAEFFAKRGLREDLPLVVCAPFSTGDNKCWEPERFAALMADLHRDHQAQIVMTLGPRDGEQARAIAEMSGVPVQVAEGTSLRQYVALLRRADLVVSVDSSPMHIAAALGTPYLALFGPTPVKELAPLAGKGLPMVNIEGLPCAPCYSNRCTHPTYRACMKAITVDRVRAEAARLLADRGTIRTTGATPAAPDPILSRSDS